MRHHSRLAEDSFTRVTHAAAWPGTAPAAAIAAAEPAEPADFAPTPSSPDVAAGVGVLIAGAYAALIGAFALATVATAHSAFMLTIAALFVVAFMTVPFLFLAIEPGGGRRPSFERFLHDGMATMTGHCRGRDALIQMLIVPVLLTLGVLAMGVAIAFAL